MEVECKWVGLLHWISMKNNSIFVIVATHKQKNVIIEKKIIYLNKREKQFKLNCDILHLILTKKLKWFIKKLLTFL